MVVDMCQTNDLSLVNTYFQHSRARLTTWRSPDHQTENTIDYVLTRKKDCSSTTDAIALGGADADSDHKLLKATFRWKWRSKRTSHATARVNVHALASLKEQFNNTTADYAQESDNFEQALISASKDVLTTRTANRGNKFISDETLELIGKKLAAWKRRNEPGMIELYRTLQRSVKRSLRADEEKWADNLCSNINAACDRGDAREMHKLTKELLGEKGNVRKRTIKDQHGAVIADEEGQLARWHQYCKSLFRSDLPRSGEQHLPANDDNALSSTEIKQAIKKMKNGKAAAADGLRAEMFKALTDENLNCLVEDVKAVWSSGEVRDHWRCAELLPFYKNKGDSGDCPNYRTIAIIPQYSKIVLVCIANRLKDKVEEVCSEAQFGFRAGPNFCATKYSAATNKRRPHNCSRIYRFWKGVWQNTAVEILAGTAAVRCGIQADRPAIRPLWTKLRLCQMERRYNWAFQHSRRLSPRVACISFAFHSLPWVCTAWMETDTAPLHRLSNIWDWICRRHNTAGWDTTRAPAIADQLSRNLPNARPKD